MVVVGAVILTAVVLVAAVVYWLLGTEPPSLKAMFVTPDQQAQKLYEQERYAEAAERFTDPYRQAAALFRAGEFKRAASIYAGLDSPEAAFNHGNALIMQGKYEEAVKRYDRALALRPGWEDARINREIAALRAERLKLEGGEMTGGMLGADEISFETGKGKGDGGDEVVEDKALSDAELRSVWLRRVQTNPADFLKSKFAYQHTHADE